MTRQIVEYTTEAAMKTDKAVKVRQGFRALHIDFINNDKSQGYKVTYDNTVLPIDPSHQKRKDLQARLTNNTISFNELKELLRLSGIISNG